MKFLFSLTHGNARVSSRLVALTLALVACASSANATTQGELQAASATQMSARERRASAYAKFLEGQRLLLGARRRGTITPVTRERAQKAFAEAAALDPALAEAHTALAEIAFYTGDAPIAEREARRAIAINKDNFGAHRLLARLLAQPLLGKDVMPANALDAKATDAAIAQLREVLRLKSRDAEALALLGELYERSNKSDDAIRTFALWAEQPVPLDTGFYESVIGGELSIAAANARLGQALLNANRASEAIVALRRALVAEPANPAYALLLEQVLESGTDADGKQIIGELETIVRQNPANVQAVRFLARRQARAGRTEEAVNALRQALKGNAAGAISKEDRRQLQLAIGETYAQALLLDEAVVAYEAALLLNGINDEPLTSDDDKGFAGTVLESMLELRRQQGQWTAAENLVARMRILLGDADPSIDLQLIITMRDQGKRAETLKAAQTAKTRFPEQPVFLRLEASALADLGRVDEAVKLLQDRRRPDADAFGTQLYVANIYTQAGRAREAIAAAEAALRLAGAGERETQALLLLASARERGGDAKGAEEALRRVLTREPNNATALNNLGYFLVERGTRLEEALALIERAVRIEPSNGSFLDSFGWALFKLGRFAESERQLAEAARRNPASATIQEHLGDVYERLGKAADARFAWQRALTLTSRAEEGTRLKSKLSGITQ